MKKLALAAVLTLTAGLVVQAQQSTQTPPASQTPPAQQSAPDEKEKPKADAKPAPALAGKWNMSLETQQGAMASVLDLKVDGKKVTGTISSQMGEAPIEGEFADGKLTLTMSYQGSNGSMQLAFTGALKDDGTMAGTMDIPSQNIQMPWKAERVK
jgi:hypothetical protein